MKFLTFSMLSLFVLQFNALSVEEESTVLDHEMDNEDYEVYQHNLLDEEESHE